MTIATLPRFVLILMKFDSSMLDAGLEMRELNATLFFQQTLLLSCGRDKNNFPPSALLADNVGTNTRGLGGLFTFCTVLSLDNLF